jgi:hypothetical protein
LNILKPTELDILAPSASDLDALKVRIKMMYTVIQTYRKMGRDLFIKQIVQEKIRLIDDNLRIPLLKQAMAKIIRKSFQKGRFEWKSIEATNEQQSLELKDFEHQKLDNRPSFMECDAEKWVDTAETKLAIEMS